MKSRIYYAICFERTDSTGRTIGHDDPTKSGAWGLFYRRDTALKHARMADKVERVLVTIESAPARNKKASKNQ